MQSQSTDCETESDCLLTDALAAARDTRALLVDPHARKKAADVFRSLFGAQHAIVVADQNTFAVAGTDVQESFRTQGAHTATPFVFGPDVHAEHSCVEQLTTALSRCEAVPVAVGSGTINDLTKLAAHRLHRPYMAVAT